MEGNKEINKDQKSHLIMQIKELNAKIKAQNIPKDE